MPVLASCCENLCDCVGQELGRREVAVLIAKTEVQVWEPDWQAEKYQVENRDDDRVQVSVDGLAKREGRQEEGEVFQR